MSAPIDVAFAPDTVVEPAVVFRPGAPAAELTDEPFIDVAPDLPVDEVLAR